MLQRMILRGPSGLMALAASCSLILLLLSVASVPGLATASSRLLLRSLTQDEMYPRRNGRDGVQVGRCPGGAMSTQG